IRFVAALSLALLTSCVFHGGDSPSVVGHCSEDVFAPAAAAPASDVILDWNNQMIGTIRATGGPPTPPTRSFAMMHLAMYEAVNSVERRYSPYRVLLTAQADTSCVAAAASAAHRVLTTLYPSRQAVYDSALANSLASVPDGTGESNGVALGIAAAGAIIALRSNDGSDDNTPYVLGTTPGDWRPTPPDFTAPFTPNWGKQTPWAITSGAQFRPPLPTALTMPAYAAALNEVKDLGDRNSAMRTPEQTRIAYFWANDVDDTYKPPGHLNYITQVIATNRHLSLYDKARLFALLNIALADAAITAWDCKYVTPMDLWRPVTAIREADTDGNAATVADPNWLPLNAFTPPFPSYTSGHATFAGAHAEILTLFFGTDNIPVTIGTDEPLYTGGPRTYTSMLAMAQENGRSRIYLGIHYQFDADFGVQSGQQVARYVFAHFLTS
ncbi:MAG: vanadium-dependent haloperoxidase, partial [bacterium]